MTPGLLINGNTAAKKRLAPQPPKPLRTGVTVTTRTKVDDSYSTMSTLSVNSVSPNSTVSEKSIKVKPTRKPLPRKISTATVMMVDSAVPLGWIRVYCGQDQSAYSDEDPNKVLQINQSDTVEEIALGIGLPIEYTIWMQVNGMHTRRLQDDECPLMMQERLLKSLGYQNEFRRSRLGIDPELKSLLRFHIGPAEMDSCRGVTKSGQVEILKGLVSPQWKTRTMCIVGAKLIIFPGLANFNPKELNLNKLRIKLNNWYYSE